jgi:hypothetical protein
MLTARELAGFDRGNAEYLHDLWDSSMLWDESRIVNTIGRRLDRWIDPHTEER